MMSTCSGKAALFDPYQSMLMQTGTGLFRGEKYLKCRCIGLLWELLAPSNGLLLQLTHLPRITHNNSKGLIQLPCVSPEDWRSCHAQHSAWCQGREGVWNLDLIFRYYFETPTARRKKIVSGRTSQKNNPSANGRHVDDTQQGNINHWLDSIVRLGSNDDHDDDDDDV